MSNWASVILTWPSIDEAEPHDQRRDWILAEYLRRASSRPLLQAEYLNGAFPCECVVVLGINHVDRDELTSILAQMRWEYPGEVQALVKTEDDDLYRDAMPKRAAM